MIAIGRRLGSKLSPADLERLGETEARVLAALTRSERASLSTGYLGFDLDRPALVRVATPPGHTPFWLADLGFVDEGREIAHPDGRFRIHSRHFAAGHVGLGVNSLDRRAIGHYVVFVSDAPPSTSATKLDRVAPVGIDRVIAGPGVGAFADDDRPFLDLPADLVGSVQVRPRRDWRDASALVRGKVWKTRVASTPNADQVVVGFDADPARSLTWTWRTDRSSSRSEVKVRKNSEPESRARIVSGESVEVESSGLLNDLITLRHRVGSSGFEPDTTYYYALADGSPGGWSTWHEVRTAPTIGRDYGFLYMGDPQCGLEAWGELLHAARKRRPDAGFLLIAGDLVDRGNERSNWDHFFSRAAGVFEGLPLLPAVGNHEYLDRGPAIFASTFLLPTGGPHGEANRLAYAFDYADSFVAVLDSNPAVYSAERAREQAEWLDDRLARTKARWKFVVFHHPIYASHPSREQPQLGAAWSRVIDERGVDFVLQGHDHSYQRTHPIRGGVVSPDGATYVVAVSGQKFVPQRTSSLVAKGFTDLATYQSIDISPARGTLLYRAFDLEGRELDRLELSKGRPAEMARISP